MWAYTAVAIAALGVLIHLGALWGLAGAGFVHAGLLAGRR